MHIQMLFLTYYYHTLHRWEHTQGENWQVFAKILVKEKKKSSTFDILFFRKCLKPYAFKLYPAVSIKQFLNLFDITSLLDLLGFFYFKAYTSVGHLLARWIRNSPLTFLTLNLPSTYLRHVKTSPGKTIKMTTQRYLLRNHLPQNTVNCRCLRAMNISPALILIPTKTIGKFIAITMPGLFPFFLCQTIFFSNITFNLTPHILKRIADFLVAFCS